jgi:hypothetical protein
MQSSVVGIVSIIFQKTLDTTHFIVYNTHMTNTPSFIDHTRRSKYDSQFLRMIAEKHYYFGAGKYTPEGERIMEIADKIDMVTGELPKSDPADTTTFFDEVREIGEEMRRNEQQAALDRIAELDKEMGIDEIGDRR